MSLPTPSYLVGLRLAGRPCLVVGGGRTALAKLPALLRSGASVTVVAPSVRPELRSLPVRLFERCYRDGEVAGYRLVLATTGHREVDHAVYAQAEEHGVFANVPDNVGCCSYFLPALLRRGPVSVAVSTDGASPALAAVLRDRLAALAGEEVGTVAAVLSEARSTEQARRSLCGPGSWRALAERLLDKAASGASPERLREEADRWLGIEERRGSEVGDE